MQSFRTNYPWIFRSLILTPILAVISLGSILGEGLINPFLYKLFYPYIFFFLIFSQIEDHSITSIIIYMGFFLYLVYGIILTIADRKGKLNVALRVIVITHVIVALLCVLFF